MLHGAIFEAEIETITVRGFLLTFCHCQCFQIVFIHGHRKLNCHQILSNFFHEMVHIVNDIILCEPEVQLQKYY